MYQQMRTPHVRTLIALLFSLHYHLGDTWLQHTTRNVMPSKHSPWCNGQNVWWLNGCIVLWSTCPQPRRPMSVQCDSHDECSQDFTVFPHSSTSYITVNANSRWKHL